MLKSRKFNIKQKERDEIKYGKNLFKNQKSEEHGGIFGQGEPNVKIEQIMEKKQK